MTERTPELRRELAAAAALQTQVPMQAAGLVLAFEPQPLPGLAGSPQATAFVAVDRTGDGTVAKLVVHVKEICLDDMARITPALQRFYVSVLMGLPGAIEMEAGESPMFRNQWDCCIWGVPAMRVDGVKQLLIQTLRQAAATSASVPLPW